MKLGANFWELLLCTVGIMGFFVFYGFLQEKLMTRPYEPSDPSSKFKDTAFLVLCNRLVAMCVALFMTWKRNETIRNTAPIQNYFYVSFSNFAATFCQYEALKYVTFPTQTLGKCGKMVPVLVIGSVFYRKPYTWKDYIVAFAVMTGCTLFLTTGEITSSKGAESDTPIGLALLVGYLFFDGFTSTTQEKMFKGYTMSTYNQMLYVNASSAILSLVALIGNGTLFTAIDFALKYPAMLRDAVLLSLCASLGQMVIYHTIKSFGALVYSTIMTTRQFASLLLSSIIFLHPISLFQWTGVVLVFGSLYYEGFMKPAKKDHNPKPQAPESKDINDLIQPQPQQQV